MTGTAQLCDLLVAADGAYAHFPGAADKPVSDNEAHHAIGEAAREAGLTLYTVVNSKPWPSEVAKRDYMIQVAKQYATADDWFFRVDADEVLRKSWNTHQLLAQTEHDVAEVLLHDATYGGATPLRCLFRNLPDLQISGAHYYVTAGDKVLCGPGQVEAEALWDVFLEHRTHERPAERRKRKSLYTNLIPDLESIPDVPG